MNLLRRARVVATVVLATAAVGAVSGVIVASAILMVRRRTLKLLFDEPPEMVQAALERIEPIEASLRPIARDGRERVQANARRRRVTHLEFVTVVVDADL